MSFRNLARASALYTIGNFLPRVGAFLLLPLYVRFLSGAEYGAVSLIISVAGFLTIFYRLGLDSALMRLHFDEAGDRQRALYTTLTAVAIASAIGGSVLAIMLMAPFFSRLFAELPFVPYGLLAVGIAAASAASFSPGVFYRATGQASKFLLYAVAIFAASSLASVTLVILGWGATGMLVGQLAGGLFGMAVTIVLVVRLAGSRFDPSLIPSALRFGLPLVPHLVSGWALRLADRMLIGLLIGLPATQALGELGAYSLGYQLGYMITLIVLSFNTAWSPWFFRIAHESGAPVLFRGMMTVVIAGLLALGVGVAVLAPQIVAVIARPEYQSAASVLPVVAMASVLYAFYTMLTTVVFYAKATGRLALITVSAAILNILVNVVLIPPFGILGAAWATFAAYGYFALATWRYASTVYPVHLDVRRLALLAGLALVALLAANRTDLLGSDAVIVALRLTVAVLFAGVAVVIALPAARDLRWARRVEGSAGNLTS